MVEYEEIKTELNSIAELVGKFSEAVQPRVFEILIQAYFGNDDPPSSPETDAAIPKKKVAKKKVTKKVAKKKPASGSSGRLSLEKDLNLNGDGKTLSLADFVNEKKPATNILFNAVCVYYLKNLLSLSTVGPNHIYTCYKKVNRKTPKSYGAFIQSLRDTSSSDYGYIDASNTDDLTCPLLGESFVEHDLPAT